MTRFIVCGTLLFLGGVANAQAPSPASANPNLPGSDLPVRMTPAEILKYNAGFAATDSRFIKCVRTENPGSMVKRRICRTNEDWDQRAENASDEARAIVDNIQLHGSTHGQEPADSIVPLTPN